MAVSKIAEATKELQALKGQSQRQRSAIKNLEIARNDLTAKVESMRKSMAQDELALNSLRIQIADKNSQNEKLITDVAKITNKLSSLRANVDLFPTELELFVTQGRNNIKALFALTIIPIMILLTMFILLISGAVDLTTKIDPEGKVNIAALVASRAPYVAVALAIITACYKIARYFMIEMIEINRQRLNLTKIAIIAKDVSNAAEIGLELNDVERYGLRVRLKMALLKDHLKSYLSSNLKVQLPSSITEYLPFDITPQSEDSEEAAVDARGR